MRKLFILALTVTVGFAASASAAPFTTAANVRPVSVGPGDGSEPSLSSLLDQIFLDAPGTWDATADQSSAGIWGLATSPGTTIPTLAFEFSGGAPQQTFGIWFGDDTSALFTYEIFEGAANGVNNGGAPFGTAAGVGIANGVLTVTPGPGGPCPVEVNCGTAFDMRINPGRFGFYMTTGGSTYYTLDELNLFNSAQAVTFQDGASTNWAIAFEDLFRGSSGGSFDYNDMVVKIESVNAVPEPGSLMLLGSGLLGAARFARRRLARKRA